jgi:hypothetical protein
MTPEDFRELALAMPDAVEMAHMGHPDFRVKGKIFASLCPKDGWGMVKLTPEQQAAFLRSAPETFTPANGAWGRNGATIVTLKNARETEIREALEMAVQNAGTKRRARK